MYYGDCRRGVCQTRGNNKGYIMADGAGEYIVPVTGRITWSVCIAEALSPMDADVKARRYIKKNYEDQKHPCPVSGRLEAGTVDVLVEGVKRNNDFVINPEHSEGLDESGWPEDDILGQ